MAYIERQTRDEKTYFYVTKNFRIDSTKWKKIRKYVGNQKPSPEDFKSILGLIDAEAKEKGWRKKRTAYKYLPDDLAETLEDVRQNYSKSYGKLGKAEKKKFDEDFLVRFTYNTNAIEGNRLSLRETSMLLTEDITPTGASTKDFNEALNGRDCLEYIRPYKGNLGKKFILKVHRELTKNTGCRLTGRYRDSQVRISGSEWMPPKPENVEAEMNKLLGWWRNNQNRLHPVELAGAVHNMLVRTHPFTDGNGRTARVLMNWILLHRKYPMFYIENKEKAEYYRAIEEGDRGDDSAFIRYLAKTLIEQHTFKSKQ